MGEEKNEEKITLFEVMIQSRCSVIGTGMNGRFVGKLYYKKFAIYSHSAPGLALTVFLGVEIM